MTQIRISARSSPLSQAQVKEVYEALKKFHPQVEFILHFVQSKGDLDKKTSLRSLDKTDFFTKEIDDLVLEGICQVAVHSAKDLPEPIPKGLSLIALTKGIDSSDSLVFRQGESLYTLPSMAKIATSTARREETVKMLRSDLCFIDLRGNIGERLAMLDNGKADGVVVAEAALIRLGLTHLNRIALPGTTAEFQGRLAILARQEDHQMKEFFACLDARRST